MSLLADRFYELPFRMAPWWEEWAAESERKKGRVDREFAAIRRDQRMMTLKHLSQCVIITADDVCNYAFPEGSAHRGARVTLPLENLVPPYPKCWIEYTLPFWNEVFYGDPPRKPARCGVMLRSYTRDEMDEEDVKLFRSILSPDQWAMFGWTVYSELYWEVDLKTEPRPSVWGPMGVLQWFLDHRGGAMHAVFDDQTGNQRLSSREKDVFSEVLGLFCVPAYWCIEFLHCRNVVLSEGEQPPSKLARAYQKRHGRPLVQHKTLHVIAPSQVTARNTKGEPTGEKRPLHLCRGHFADYTQGKGLFGKYQGKFWIPAHVRGSKKVGMVIKDYDVTPAEKVS